MLRSQYLVRLQLAAPADGGTSELKIAVIAGGASASGSATFVRPGAPSPTVVAPVPKAVTSSGSTGGGGSNFAVFALAGGLVVLLLGGGYAGVRRVRRGGVAATSAGPTKSTHSYTPSPVAAWAGESAPTARLLVIGGPDQGKKLALGDDAVTLGTDADCTLSLANPDGRVGGHHARVWLREGHFMLHHLAGAGYATLVADERSSGLSWKAATRSLSARTVSASSK